MLERTCLEILTTHLLETLLSKLSRSGAGSDDLASNLYKHLNNLETISDHLGLLVLFIFSERFNRVRLKAAGVIYLFIFSNHGLRI